MNKKCLICKGTIRDYTYERNEGVCGGCFAVETSKVTKRGERYPKLRDICLELVRVVRDIDTKTATGEEMRRIILDVQVISHNLEKEINLIEHPIKNGSENGTTI